LIGFETFVIFPRPAAETQGERRQVVNNRHIAEAQEGEVAIALSLVNYVDG